MATIPGGAVTVSGGSNTVVNSFAATLLTAINAGLADNSLALSNASLAGGGSLVFPTVSGGASVVGYTTVPGTINLTSQPTSVSSVVIDATGNVNLIGSGQSGLEVISGASSNLTFFSNGGTGTVVATGGSNLLGTQVSGGGAWDFVAGSGNDRVEAVTGDNTIALAAGNNTIDVFGGGSSILSQGNDIINVVGGTATIVAADNGAAFVNVWGAGHATFVGGNATHQTVSIFDSSGNSISGGSVPGGSLYASAYFGTGNNTIVSGLGDNFLVAGKAGDVVSVMGAGSNVIFAGTGNETLTALNTTGKNIFYTNFSATTGNNDTIVGGQGNDTFWTNGNVNATVTSNSGADVFQIVKGLAPQNITVTDWSSSDTLNTFGLGTATFATITGGYQAPLADGSTIKLLTSASSLNGNIHSF
jgi:hypothetical protein